MAYVSQDMKAKLAPKIKSILKKYGIKGSIAVRHHSTLVLNIASGKIDFIKNYNETCKNPPGIFNTEPAKDNLQVNEYWYHEHFSGKAKAFLDEMIPAMEGPDYFNHDDAQTDYFNRSHYIDINIGRWNKPYKLAA